ncbi:hypothetical protein ACFZDG_15715 [Kitasatospora xanthocidica]|uniref:hypothetical protein n=1 Tax=Kitasatospora xanthocidica TaxID=83382 RepID=UPI0036E87EDF
MRALLEIEFDTPAANQAVNDGSMAEGIKQSLAQLKPEAAYFLARNGQRTMIAVIDVPDEASLPSIAEPFWSQANAKVDLHVCMNADELLEGLGRLSS